MLPLSKKVLEQQKPLSAYKDNTYERGKLPVQTLLKIFHQEGDTVKAPPEMFDVTSDDFAKESPVHYGGDVPVQDLSEKRL